MLLLTKTKQNKTKKQNKTTVTNSIINNVALHGVAACCSNSSVAHGFCTLNNLLHILLAQFEMFNFVAGCSCTSSCTFYFYLAANIVNIVITKLTIAAVASSISQACDN